MLLFVYCDEFIRQTFEIDVPALVDNSYVWPDTGAVSAAAMKRWEKAAMAGVSLVADAAEHLERAAGEWICCVVCSCCCYSIDVSWKNIKWYIFNFLIPQTYIDQLNYTEQTDSGPSVQVQANTLNLSKGIAFEDNLQATMKLKLQLFPIDESTRKALEMVS